MAIFMFAAGIWACQQQATLPGWPVLGLAAAGLTIATLRLFRQPIPHAVRVRVLMAALACVAGFVWAATRAQVRLADFLAEGMEGVPVVMTGVVADLPLATADGTRFVFEVEEAPPGVPRRVQLDWPHPGAQAEGEGSTDRVPRLRPGERWRLNARLQRPHGAMNPHGGDYEATLLERGVRATGRVLPKSGAEMLAAWVADPVLWIHRLRDVVRERFRAALPGRPYAGVLIALAIGDQQAIPQAQWEIFRRTGIAHLVSISGLHVSMVGLLLAWIVGWKWRRMPHRVVRCPASKVAAAAGFVGAAGYAALAGMSVPTQRSLVMLAVLALAVLSGRETGGVRLLAIALLCVLLFDPWAVLAPGFWLSFGAVAVMILVLGGRLRRQEGWRAGVSTQLGITLGTVPALLGLFNGFSVVSPFANALAIPVVSFAITPLVLLAMVLPAAPLLKLAHALMAALMVALEWMARLPWAMWQQAAAPGYLVLAATLGVGWAMLPRGTPGRTAGVLAMFPLLAWAPPRPAEGEARIVTLDVGQGTAVHVQTAEHDLLYDAGPATPSGRDAGARVVVPYLNASGVARLDRAIVSHDDSDHSGGMPAVLAALPVGRLTADVPVIERVRGVHAGPAEACVAGAGWNWDGVEFRILHPVDDARRDGGDNNASCVLQVVTRGARALLSGDIERAAEEVLLAREREALAADLVVVPHHGSRSSSGADFVAATGADAVVYSAGYRNVYRHPSPEVVERWAASGATGWRTDRQGAIVAMLGDRGLAVTAQRSVAARYWHGR